MKYDMSRFIKAQELDYQRALAEIKNGKKESHWIWYIFPQIKGLGKSSQCNKYDIVNLEEAKAYLAEPILRKHLIEICEALLSLDTNDAVDVMERPDNLKLRSSMTLFSIADPEETVFKEVLEKFYKGKPDYRTLKILGIYEDKKIGTIIDSRS